MTWAVASEDSEWALVVRRSFEISDLVSQRDAREALIRRCEAQLRDNGWQRPTRAVAEPITDALLSLGAIGSIDDRSAYRLLERGTNVVDPEHLVFDVMSEFPPEVVAAAQQLLDVVSKYAYEEPRAD